MNRRLRRWVLGSAVVFTCLAVWWVEFRSPTQERLVDLDLEAARVLQERESLARKIERLSGEEKDSKQAEADLGRLAGLMVEGSTIEAVNAVTQAAVQAFLETKQITLKSYKEVGSGKWRGHTVGRVEFQFSTDLQGLSDVLEFVEGFKQAVRIESLTINHTRARRRGVTKDEPLTVSLQLGTLFVQQLQ
jgi:hypothetical protein